MTRVFIRTLAALALAAASLPAASAAEPIPSADQRYAAPAVNEVPDFQRHVTPLLGRLGCNGRACHGSFQGQGGFRLSLFGYDFAADHVAMTGGESPRVDLKNPDESLILSKPTLAVEHDGGKRMEKGSWEYTLLRRWIEAGTPTVSDKAATFDRLEVSPNEFVSTGVGQSFQLRATAFWSDGTSEVVTPLCRFRSNDEAIATVDLSGKVTIQSPGDTHVVVFYENGVAPVSVMLPVSEQTGDKYPDVPAPTTIDKLVVQKLKKLGVVPSELCTDQEFLRRVSLDLTGTLPTPDEVVAFLQDGASDKRERKIDELLSRPEYAAWWATRLCDVLGASEENITEKAGARQMSKQWHAWVEKRVAENAPYDEIIEGIVLAVSRDEGVSYREYCEKASALIREDDAAAFAAQPSMPHFWARQNVRTPNEKALAFSHAFLGVRLQCAECHKHPFDQWTQQDFEQFTAFFTGVQFGVSPDAKDEAKKMEAELEYKEGINRNKQNTEALRAGKTIPLREVFVNQRAVARKKGEDKNAKAGRVITPRLLGGDEVVAKKYPDPRVALMDWMRDENNPYFARAIVNRVWSNYFGVGIVEPADDMNLANPPSNAELLDDLAKRFVERGYDLKWLHREITTSRTYQLSWKPNETNVNDARNFSHASLRRVPAEVAYDAIVQATAAGSDASIRQPVEKRMIGPQSGFLVRGTSGYALVTFGKPERESNCDCERSNEPSLLQTVYLRNDGELTRMLDRRDGWVARVGGGAVETPVAKNGDRPKRGGKKNDEPKLATIGKPKSGDGMADDSMAGEGMAGDEMAADDADEADPLAAAEDALADAESKLDKATASGKKERIEKATKAVEKLRAQVAALKKQAEAEKKPVARGSNGRAPTHAERLAIIRDAYLRTLSREPRSEEIAESEKYLVAAESIRDGARDLLWALVNTKEFIVNH